MLKIYRAFADGEQIKIQDHIKFTYGQFDTGLYGFGQVKTGNCSCTKANYELQALKHYKNYLQNIKKIDGYVENFAIFNPYSYQMLEDKYKDVKESYEVLQSQSLGKRLVLQKMDRKI